MLKQKTVNPRKKLSKRQLLAIALVFAFGLIFSAAIGVVLSAYSYQKVASEFWQEYPHPQKQFPRNFPFLLEYIIPDGGPLIAADFQAVCQGTSIPLVPFRYVGGGEIDLLCGQSLDTIHRVKVKDPELVEVIEADYRQE